MSTKERSALRKVMRRNDRITSAWVCLFDYVGWNYVKIRHCAKLRPFIYFNVQSEQTLSTSCSLLSVRKRRTKHTFNRKLNTLYIFPVISLSLITASILFRLAFSSGMFFHTSRVQS
ncbi:hypothetical protein MHYP_G00085130 [Metynnis hypsauchen]